MQDLPFTTNLMPSVLLGTLHAPHNTRRLVIASGSQAQRMLNLTEVAKDSNMLLAMAVAKAQSQIEQVKTGLTVLTVHLPLCTTISSTEVHFTVEPVKSNNQLNKRIHQG